MDDNANKDLPTPNVIHGAQVKCAKEIKARRRWGDTRKKVEPTTSKEKRKFNPSPEPAQRIRENNTSSNYKRTRGTELANKRQRRRNNPGRNNSDSEKIEHSFPATPLTRPERNPETPIKGKQKS